MESIVSGHERCMNLTLGSGLTRYSLDAHLLVEHATRCRNGLVSCYGNLAWELYVAAVLRKYHSID